jgi:hypothetical protein
MSATDNSEKISFLSSLWDRAKRAVYGGEVAQKVSLKKEKEVVKIVLSGGPCAGKTLSTKHLISKHGTGRTRVVSVPEVAAFIAQSGGFIDMSSWP